MSINYRGSGLCRCDVTLTRSWEWPDLKKGILLIKIEKKNTGWIFIIIGWLCTRGVTIRVSCIERFHGQFKWKWSSLSPWSEDFGVNRARACRYLVVWNALGEGSDLISSLSSAGMFPWQCRFADGHQHKKYIRFKKFYIYYFYILYSIF